MSVRSQVCTQTYRGPQNKSRNSNRGSAVSQTTFPCKATPSGKSSYQANSAKPLIVTVNRSAGPAAAGRVQTATPAVVASSSTGRSWAQVARGVSDANPKEPAAVEAAVPASLLARSAVLTADATKQELAKYWKTLSGNIDAVMSGELAESLKTHGAPIATLHAEEVALENHVVVSGSLVFHKEEYLTRCLPPVPPIDKKEQLFYLLEGFRFQPVGRWADAYGNFPFQKDYSAAKQQALDRTESLADSIPAIRLSLEPTSVATF